MRQLARSLLLLSLTLLTVPPGILFVPRASAATPREVSSSNNKGKNKSKKKFKQHKYKSKQLKVLKGHHGKHKGRPA